MPDQSAFPEIVAYEPSPEEVTRLMPLIALTGYLRLRRGSN